MGGLHRTPRQTTPSPWLGRRGHSALILREVGGDRGQQATRIFVVEEGGAGGSPGKPLALKLFNLKDEKQAAVFKLERANLECIDKLREDKQGTFPHIIQAKEVFEDSEGWGCIGMPLAKESLKQRM